MITKREPRCSNKEPLKLGKIFSNSDNVVYPIQSDLQRRYCWTSEHIDNLYKDYIINLYDKNKAADKNGEDGSYAEIGDAILTRREEYGHNGKCSKQEIIDMSQRITTVMAFIVCILYLFLNQNKQFDIKARRDLFDKYLKTKNGESYKVVSTFKDSNVDETINQLIENTFKYDKKDLKCFKESTAKKNGTKYKPFSALCGYVLNLIDETLGKNNETIRERLDMLLDRTYVKVEECDKSERVEKFREVNTYRLGVEDKDIYKGLLCAKGDSIDNKFQDFEAIVNEISNTSCKKISLLKTHITVTEYIMRLGIIMCDETKNSCSFNYSLGDKDNGIEWHLNNENGILNTEKKVLDYLDKCIDICNFLKESMNFNPTDFNCDWYLLVEGRNKPHIWLYNILPSYIISKITDKPKKDYAFECLLKSYLTYSIKYSSNRSVQYIQTYMYTLSNSMLEHMGDDYSFEDFKNSLDIIFKNTFGDFIKNDVTRNIKNLCYGQASSTGAIYAILSLFEYEAQKLTGVKRYRVTISMCDNSIPLFRMERKQTRVKYRTRGADALFMTNAEYVGEKEAQCIMVDSDEHLYITEDFIVTHNTSLTTAIAGYASTYPCEQNNYEGFKVLQIVFEDRVKQIQRKHFGRITGIESKDLGKPEYINTVREQLDHYEGKEMMEKNLRILRLPSGEKTAWDIERIIKRFINNGFRPDLVIVDYFECLAHRNEGTLSEWEQEGKTMRKFEAMAGTLNMAFWIPLQGTKESVNMELVTMDKAGGSFKKIQIAHIVMSIARSNEDIAENKATIAILKNRAGKAGKVFNNVEFNNGTCRISTANCDDGLDSMFAFDKKQQKDRDNLASEIFKKYKAEHGAK